MHVWLLIMFILIITLRLLIYMAELNTTLSGLSKKVLVFLYFPCFSIWNCIGIIWFKMNRNDTPECMNEEMQWIVGFWLFLSNMIHLIYLLTMIVILVDYIREMTTVSSTRLNNLLDNINDNQLNN
jgi:hypothetical protein